MANNFASVVEQMNKTREDQQKQTTSLLRVTQTVNSSLKLETFLKIISEEIKQALKVPGCEAFLISYTSKSIFKLFMNELSQWEGHYRSIRPMKAALS